MSWLNVARVALAALMMTVLSGCQAGVVEEPTLPPAEDELVSWFAERRPEVSVFITEKRDVTGDGTEDLIVVYEKPDGRNRMRVVIAGTRPIETNEVPVPQENVTLSFRDSSDENPLDFTVTGSKGVAVGFAIFRVEGMVLKDVFNEGMIDCCE